jgi:hypothetical protein
LVAGVYVSACYATLALLSVPALDAVATAALLFPPLRRSARRRDLAFLESYRSFRGVSQAALQSVPMVGVCAALIGLDGGWWWWAHPAAGGGGGSGGGGGGVALPGSSGSSSSNIQHLLPPRPLLIACLALAAAHVLLRLALLWAEAVSTGAPSLAVHASRALRMRGGARLPAALAREAVACAVVVTSGRDEEVEREQQQQRHQGHAAAAPASAVAVRLRREGWAPGTARSRRASDASDGRGEEDDEDDGARIVPGHLFPADGGVLTHAQQARVAAAAVQEAVRRLLLRRQRAEGEEEEGPPAPPPRLTIVLDSGGGSGSSGRGRPPDVAALLRPLSSAAASAAAAVGGQGVAPTIDCAVRLERCHVGADALSGLLVQQRSLLRLRRLHLARCHLGRGACAALASGGGGDGNNNNNNHPASALSLEAVSLVCCSLSDGADAAADALVALATATAASSPSSLRSLALCGCGGGGARLASGLAQALREGRLPSSLERVNLAYSRVGSAAARELAEALRGAGARARGSSSGGGGGGGGGGGLRELVVRRKDVSGGGGGGEGDGLGALLALLLPAEQQGVGDGLALRSSAALLLAPPPPRRAAGASTPPPSPPSPPATALELVPLAGPGALSAALFLCDADLDAGALELEAEEDQEQEGGNNSNRRRARQQAAKNGDASAWARSLRAWCRARQGPVLVLVSQRGPADAVAAAVRHCPPGTLAEVDLRGPAALAAGAGAAASGGDQPATTPTGALILPPPPPPPLAFGDAGAARLGDALSSAPPATRAGLRALRLPCAAAAEGPAAAAGAAAAAAASLPQSVGLTDAGLSALIPRLPLSGLHELDLGACTLTDAAVEEALLRRGGVGGGGGGGEGEAEESEGPTGTPASSPILPSLQVLDLGGNRFPLEVSTLRRLSAAAATEVRLRAGQQQRQGKGEGALLLPPPGHKPPLPRASVVAGGRRAPRESLGANADEDDEETCGVCLDAEVALRVRPCGHRLCVSCLRLLLRAELQQQQQSAQRHHSQQQQACPFCRGPLRGFEYCAVLPGEPAEAPEDDERPPPAPPPRGEELC